jgi:hypothetical protein
MTSINAAADALAYEMAVLTLYLDLPDTPVNCGVSDQFQARRWLERGISLPTVETALLLGSLRRLLRPAEAPPLQSIRSLAYFQPVLEELLHRPVPDNYRTYLQRKLQSLRARDGAPSRSV